MNPTYLYVKTCNHCGKKYFGKTTENNPYKYRGSGVHWKSHLKKHKCSYTTIIYSKNNIKQITMIKALHFSIFNNIVKSDKWFNLCYENGLDGGDTISKHSKNKEIRKKISKNAKKRKGEKNGFYNKGYLISGEKNPMYGKNHSKETRKKQSEKAKKRPRVSCLNCHNNYTINNFNKHYKSCINKNKIF